MQMSKSSDVSPLVKKKTEHFKSIFDTHKAPQNERRATVKHPPKKIVDPEVFEYKDIDAQPRRSVAAKSIGGLTESTPTKSKVFNQK
jgi:hypothetical protein